MKNVVVMGRLPNENLGNQTYKLMKQSAVIASPKFIKPTCVVEVEKYFDNMQKLSKQCVGLASVQCANDNVQNFCMVSVPESLVSTRAYTSEVLKSYTKLNEIYCGQSVNSDVRELYRELCEKSL